MKQSSEQINKLRGNQIFLFTGLTEIYIKSWEKHNEKQASNMTCFQNENKIGRLPNLDKIIVKYRQRLYVELRTMT